MRETNNYEVLVSNIGRVHRGTAYYEALGEYGAWIRESKSEHGGRAKGSTVTLMKNGEPMRDYVPNDPRRRTTFVSLKWAAGRVREVLDDGDIEKAVQMTLRGRRTKPKELAVLVGLVVGAMLDADRREDEVSRADLVDRYLRTTLSI